jgi:hypothetical protein
MVKRSMDHTFRVLKGPSVKLTDIYSQFHQLFHFLANSPVSPIPLLYPNLDLLLKDYNFPLASQGIAGCHLLVTGSPASYFGCSTFNSRHSDVTIDVLAL